jgi:hypothetical protein
VRLIFFNKIENLKDFSFRIFLIIVSSLIVLSQADLTQSHGWRHEILPIPSANNWVSGDFKAWMDCMVDCLKIMGAGDDISDLSNWLQPEKMKEKLNIKYDVANFVCEHGGLYMWGLGALAIFLGLIFCCFCCIVCKLRR